MPFEPIRDFPKSADVGKDENSINGVILNGQRYLFACVMDNGEQQQELPHKYINSLVLNDSLIGFSQTGSITYEDPNFSIRRLFSKMNAIIGEDCITEDDSPDSALGDFAFRGSEVRIHIKMMPLAAEDDDELTATFRSGDWIIMGTYVVTDIKNTPTQFFNKQYRLEFEGIESHTLNKYRISEFPGVELVEQNLVKKMS